MGLFFEAVESEARSRETGLIFDINSYLVHRRDNSACKPCFDLLEYTLAIDLPDFVVKDGAFQAISQCANDFIALTNVRTEFITISFPTAINNHFQDILSYNSEQSRGETYSIVVIVMKTYNLGLQAAVDHVADMCRETLDSYCEYKTKLPSWTPQIDRDVAEYIQGLDDWISGSFHWAFITERYFGVQNDHIRKTGIIELLPPGRVQANAA